MGPDPGRAVPPGGVGATARAARPSLPQDLGQHARNKPPSQHATIAVIAKDLARAYSRRSRWPFDAGSYSSSGRLPLPSRAWVASQSTIGLACDWANAGNALTFCRYSMFVTFPGAVSSLPASLACSSRLPRSALTSAATVRPSPDAEASSRSITSWCFITRATNGSAAAVAVALRTARETAGSISLLLLAIAVLAASIVRETARLDWRTKRPNTAGWTGGTAPEATCRSERPDKTASISLARCGCDSNVLILLAIPSLYGSGQYAVSVPYRSAMGAHPPSLAFPFV